MTIHQSKIEKLIAELCPDGVEFKALGEVGKVVMCKRVFKHETSPVGQIPFYKIGTFGKEPNAFISREVFEAYRNKFSYPKVGDVLLSASGTIGRRVVYDGEPAYFQDSNIIWLEHDEKTVLNKYLFHFYATVTWQTEGGTIQRLYNDNFKKIKIPIPPLAIQEEIVRILDHFTGLEAELEAELEARKKQYEYYRENLLTFDNNVEFKKLGDLCSLITKGTTPNSYEKNGVAFIKTEAFEGTRINQDKLSYINETTHQNILKRSILQENDILFTIAGATIGKCAIVTKDVLPANTNQALAIIRLTKKFKRMYVFYLLQSKLMKNYIETKAKGSAQPNLNLQQINDFQIPIPQTAEQERIVAILDKFDALVNDISIGLPAELNARRKQYEYYRNRLLTFKSL